MGIFGSKAKTKQQKKGKIKPSFGRSKKEGGVAKVGVAGTRKIAPRPTKPIKPDSPVKQNVMENTLTDKSSISEIKLDSNIKPSFVEQPRDKDKRVVSTEGEITKVKEETEKVNLSPRNTKQTPNEKINKVEIPKEEKLKRKKEIPKDETEFKKGRHTTKIYRGELTKSKGIDEKPQKVLSIPFFGSNKSSQLKTFEELRIMTVSEIISSHELAYTENYLQDISYGPKIEVLDLSNNSVRDMFESKRIEREEELSAHKALNENIAIEDEDEELDSVEELNLDDEITEMSSGNIDGNSTSENTTSPTLSEDSFIEELNLDGEPDELILTDEPEELLLTEETPEEILLLEETLEEPLLVEEIISIDEGEELINDGDLLEENDEDEISLEELQLDEKNGIVLLDETTIEEPELIDETSLTEEEEEISGFVYTKPIETQDTDLPLNLVQDTMSDEEVEEQLLITNEDTPISAENSNEGLLKDAEQYEVINEPDLQALSSLKNIREGIKDNNDFHKEHSNTALSDTLTFGESSNVSEQNMISSQTYDFNDLKEEIPIMIRQSILDGENSSSGEADVLLAIQQSKEDKLKSASSIEEFLKLV